MSSRRKQGRLTKMSSEQKAKRAAKRARQKNTSHDWRARVWARKHILDK